LFEVFNSHNLSAKNDIKELWRWLKRILKESLKTQENKPLKESSKVEEMKEFCEKIISEFGLKDIKELKTYMNDLALKNVKNKTRVERMKKLLLRGKKEIILDPASKHSINESQLPK
jgi:Icc-related predicted phosphoesterase